MTAFFHAPTEKAVGLALYGFDIFPTVEVLPSAAWECTEEAGGWVKKETQAVKAKSRSNVQSC